MSKAFKKHLLITLAMAVLFGLLQYIFGDLYKAIKSGAVVVIVQMLIWMSFSKTFEADSPD